GAHLFRRCAFLRDKNAARGTAVARRKQSEWQVCEEKPKADDASEKDRYRQIRAVKKTIECAAVPIDHTLDEIAGPTLHSRLFVARPAFIKNSCAHQRR